MSSGSPPKKDVMISLLERGGVFVHLDPRRSGVSVPMGFRQQPELVLQVGLNMAVPIPDLEVDEEGVFCTLSFNRRPFYCRMPWHAVYALVSDQDQRGVVWREDAPRESKLSGGSVEPKRPRLRAVGPEDAPPDDEADAPPPAPPEGPGECRECGVRWVEGEVSCVVCGCGPEAFQAADDEDQPSSPHLKAPARRGGGLASVPPPGPDDAQAEADAEAKEPDAEPPGDGDPAEPDPPPEGSRKSKRPPWLRVVK